MVNKNTKIKSDSDLLVKMHCLTFCIWIYCLHPINFFVKNLLLVLSVWSPILVLILSKYNPDLISGSSSNDNNIIKIYKSIVIEKK